MAIEPVKVLLVSTHPVQYGAPQFRRYSADPRLEVTVAYCSLRGAQRSVDHDFGTEIAWDVPLLDGYRWVNPPNRSPWPESRGFFGLFNPGLWPIIRRGDFDIVVCYGYNSASFWIAGLAGKLRRTSVVLTTDAHTLAPRDGRNWKAPIKRLVLPVVFRLADGVFAPSSRSVAFLEDLSVPRMRVFLTPFVIDNSFFSRASRAVDTAAVRQRWRVPVDAPVALFCGKLAPWKRPLDLLDAASRVEGLYLVYAGDGSLRQELDDRARRLGLSGRVRFLGFVNQRALPEVYAASDFLVLPSEHEPFGVVVNEAFACGRPAIVSDACGAVGDLVQERETGFVVTVGDTSALADRLVTFARDPLMCRTMGEKARARIGEWGPEQNHQAFVQACLELARRRSR